MDNPFYRDVMRNIDEALRGRRYPTTQVETQCSECGEPMVVIRRLNKLRADPDTSPLCPQCISDLLDTEQPGSRCSGASCGWCGRCS